MDFTFTLRLNGEPWEGFEMAFPSGPEAIEGAKTILQAKIDNQPLGSAVVLKATIGVAAGSMAAGDAVFWLGEWEWSEEEADWAWTASG